MSLLLALWLHRRFIAVATILSAAVFLGYSFTQRPVYSARVTILPRSDGATAALLGPVANVLGASLVVGDNYEQLYAQIVVSDRILDLAIAESWRHASFAEPASLFEILGVESAGDVPSAREIHRLKEILRSRVISFTRRKTGFMELTVDGPRDGEFAASLANFLVDRLDAFNAEVRTRKAGERFAFLDKRLAETARKLEMAEHALTDFKTNNRAYTASPALQEEFGVLNREVQAQTSIWVELRKQVELAEIESSAEDTSVDILDRASAPVVRSKPQRPLYAVVGLLTGFLVAVLVLIMRSQIAAVRRALRSSPAE